MRREQAATAILLLLFGFAPCTFAAQKSASAKTTTTTAHAGRRAAFATLSSDDGLSVIAAALDLRSHSERSRDCSHLVNAIYDRAGFPYPYASSADLYRGSGPFRRVKHPQPGDLVVWSGHVGIVVNPARRMFFSTLSNGPGIDTYSAQYWKRLGAVRFYRYLKGISTRAALGPQ